ncbi:hypothetical protein EES40_20220 [Streptomyces sp. ADI93-02]|nr:hypothetical protein EES40_20220 [Streptomyces sp. ADI93-02]
MQQLLLCRSALAVGDLRVVHVGPALLDRAAGGRLAGGEPDLDQEVHHRAQLGDPGVRHLGQGGAQRRLVQLAELTLAEQRLRRRDHRGALLAAVHQRRQLLRQRPLGRTRLRTLLGELLQLVELLTALEAEDAHVRRDVPVVHIQPELVERVRRRHLRVEPDGAALGLAELGAVGLHHQRRRQRVDVGARLQAVDQVDPRREVAPLVAAALLEGAAVAPVQLQEVHALEELVAELRVADALLRLQPAGHRVLGEHLVDPEVLADVPEELDRGQARGPVQVVHHGRGVRALEGEEGLDLPAQPLDPRGDGLRVVQRALRGGPRVTDLTGRPADQGKRLQPRHLEPAHGEHLHQMADVQARRGRVEAAIEGDRAVRESLAQCVLVGGLGEQPAPLQLVDDVRHGRFLLAGVRWSVRSVYGGHTPRLTELMWKSGMRRAGIAARVK